MNILVPLTLETGKSFSFFLCSHFLFKIAFHCRSVSSATDSGISREASPSDTHGIIHLSTGPTNSQSSKQAQDMPVGSARRLKASEQPGLSANLLNISEPSMDTSLPPLNDTFIQGEVRFF